MAVIYLIRNTKNGKFYIGSTKNSKRRWYEHCWRLKRGDHKNAHLQAAWNLYGESSFELEILVEGATEHILRIEQAFLEKFVGLDWCYNLAISASAPMAGRTCSDETREKMRNAMTGRIRSDSHCANLSKALTGNTLSATTKNKLRDCNLGRIESELTKQKKSASWQGKTNNPDAKLTPDAVKEIRKLSETYSNVEIGVRFGVTGKTVGDVVRYKTWKHI